MTCYQMGEPVIRIWCLNFPTWHEITVITLCWNRSSILIDNVTSFCIFLSTNYFYIVSVHLSCPSHIHIHTPTTP